MYLVENDKIIARDAYLDQGYYYLGEKKVDIDNKETFDLPVSCTSLVQHIR